MIGGSVGGLGGEKGGHDQNMLYTCIKFSKIYFKDAFFKLALRAERWLTI